MKKFSFLILSLGALLLVACKTQVPQGVIEYKITFDSDDEAMKAQLAMMGTGTKTTTYKGKWLKEEQDMQVSKNTTILDTESKKGLMLVDVPMMGAKYAVKIDQESWEDVRSNQSSTDIEVEKTGEKKTIAGYECEKVIVTDPDGNEMEMWVTPEIAAHQQGERAEKIGGFPLLQQIENNNLTITYEATKVSKEEVADSVFNLAIPEGYEEKTFEELMKMQGGG